MVRPFHFFVCLLSFVSLNISAQAQTLAGIEVQSNKGASLQADAGTGWLNLNRLLDTSDQTSYLWAAFTLLGVLAVWAGLQIQSRKSLKALSTLAPAANSDTSELAFNQNNSMKLPAYIVALDLNLDLNPQAAKTSASFRSPSTTETLQ